MVEVGKKRAISLPFHLRELPMYSANQALVAGKDI